MVFVDNINIRIEYGISIVKGGYKGLVKWWSLKEPISNNWHEENGIEIDLSAPKLSSKEFDIVFIGTNYDKTKQFISFLLSSHYHDFVFEEIGISKRLRFVSHTNIDSKQGLSTFSIKFADDFPFENFTPDFPRPSNQLSKVRINDRDLKAYYGICLMKGFVDEILKLSNAKQKLKVDSKYKHGSEYFAGTSDIKLEPKELSVKCVFSKPLKTGNRYWFQDYYNLLYNLTREGEHVLNELFFNNTYHFYYKSSSVEDFAIINDDVWLEFTINLVLTNYTA